MSLYHESANILDSLTNEGASIKSLVFGKKTWKSDAKTLFALTTEAAKWSNVLSEVIEHSHLLETEKHLSPTLALVLVHDLLLSRKGIALPSNHKLHASIARHKARLGAEITRARVRRGCSSIEALKVSLASTATVYDDDAKDKPAKSRHPRWIRINTIRSTLDEQLKSTFATFQKAVSIQEVLQWNPSAVPLVYLDEHIPNLVAVPSSVDLTDSKAYKEGKIIFQDKASCFPAYLLDTNDQDGTLIDACAAPGNKTTHLAAIIHSQRPAGSKHENSRIVACEKDTLRSQTLTKMVSLAGASDIVQIKSRQNFLKLDVNAQEAANVTALLLDPSCSGSGIVGRDEGGITVHLPKQAGPPTSSRKGKKRKREVTETPSDEAVTDLAEENEAVEAPAEAEKLKSRLAALSDFQLRLLQHAMSFPAARKITYSTCSVHGDENEHIVVRALASDVALQRGWRVLRREHQVEGLRKWNRRGDITAVRVALDDMLKGSVTESASTLAEACIRCDKQSNEGTMGFFVAGFVKDDHTAYKLQGPDGNISPDKPNQSNEEEEWSGFDEDA